MAYEIPGLVVSFPAGGDLSSSQFKFVKLNASGQVVDIAAATDVPIGVLQNNPTSGQGATVMIDGITKLQADAALTVGTAIGPSADGQADAKTLGTDTTEQACGLVLEAAGAAGNYCTARIVCGLPNRAS